MLDRTELILGENRLCPECGRFLRQWRRKYLCSNCWILFGLEDTVPHHSPEGLCNFSIIKDSEVARWRICGKCGKTWTKSWEEEYLFQIFNEESFSEEYVSQRRRDLEESMERNRVICEDYQRQRGLVKKFIEYENSLGGLAPTD